jgi:hypothetical protein
MPLLWFMVDDDWFIVDEEPEEPGCMAGEPVLVVPEPEAAGRSVGGGGLCKGGRSRESRHYKASCHMLLQHCLFLLRVH